MTIRADVRVLLLSLAATSLAGCGGGGSSQTTAPLTLSVTDSAIDSTTLQGVCIQFTSITVHYAGQPGDVSLPYEPLPSQVTPDTHCVTSAWNGTDPVPPVRLDALGGALTVALADSLQVPIGRITWIRLHFSDSGSYVVDALTGQQVVSCPSCEVTDNNTGRGFKLNRTFEVTSGGIALTVDIDLRSSMGKDSTGFFLRPTARIATDDTLGTIAGEVSSSLIPMDKLYNGQTTETGCAVYVYAGHGATPVDFYDGSPVVTTARVRYDTVSGTYRYAAGALVDSDAPGPEPYTVALTCDADDPLMMGGVGFTGTQDADVTAGTTWSAPFPPVP